MIFTALFANAVTLKRKISRPNIFSIPIIRQTAIGLRIPVITLVLAATAIPVELRPLGRATLGFSIEAYDVAENIAGFVAVGIVLGEMGFLRAVIVGALISNWPRPANSSWCTATPQLPTSFPM